MPCSVTAYSVKIASPLDEAHENFIAREVISDWNAHHGLKQGRVLVALDSEGARDTEKVDILIAFFCNSPACAGEEPPEGIEEEIEGLLRAGKPVLIYFCEARNALTGTVWEGGLPDEFKKRYMTAIVESYGDDKEFRAKFSRHLDLTIGTHDHFKLATDATAEVPVKVLDPRRTGPLSPWAQTILVEACDDFEAYIGMIKAGGLLRIQANGKQLVEDNAPETIAKWESAFHELLLGEYIRDAGCNGQLFQISTKGFAFLKSVGKTPVGYIAELGGM